MKIKVSIENTALHDGATMTKKATVELWSEHDKSLKLQLWSYYHEDITILEKLMAEKETT